MTLFTLFIKFCYIRSLAKLVKKLIYDTQYWFIYDLQDLFKKMLVPSKVIFYKLKKTGGVDNISRHDFISQEEPMARCWLHTLSTIENSGIKHKTGDTFIINDCSSSYVIEFLEYFELTYILQIISKEKPQVLGFVKKRKQRRKFAHQYHRKVKETYIISIINGKYPPRQPLRGHVTYGNVDEQTANIAACWYSKNGHKFITLPKANKDQCKFMINHVNKPHTCADMKKICSNMPGAKNDEHKYALCLLTEDMEESAKIELFFLNE